MCALLLALYVMLSTWRGGVVPGEMINMCVVAFSYYHKYEREDV